MDKDREYYRKFPWSKHQTNIFWEATQGDRHLAVEAVAGSGKTSTLKGIVHWLPSNTKIKIFAFNKSVADKLNRELPGRVKIGTAHSYGYALVMGATGTYEGGLTVDTDKYWKLAKKAIQKELAGDSNSTGRFPVNERFLAVLPRYIVAVAHFIRTAIPDFSFHAVKDTLDDYDVSIPPSCRFWAIRLAMGCVIAGNKQASEQAIIDQDDMLWIPHQWKLQPRGTYDYIMVDEAQDTSAVMQSLYRKFVDKGARLIAVGDTHQCQPPGTMVKLPDNSEIPIEKLSVGDKIVTYDRRGEHYLRNGEVTEIKSRYYKGELIKIQVDGKSSFCTPNHKWMVRWNKELRGEVWATYLMRKGKSYRIGQTKLFTNANSFGVSCRAKQEGADAVWILGTHYFYKNAILEEMYLSTHFGIPQTVFNAASYNGNSSLSQKDIDDFFTALRPDQEHRAKACLESFGRDINYPIWRRKEETHLRQGRNTIFETQACNLISDLMMIISSPETIKRSKVEVSPGKFAWKHLAMNWQPLQISKEYYQGLVYSLNVEKHHKYVADGLVTCNSIFSFAGALPDAFPRMKLEFNTKEVPLPVSYRCPSSHILLASQIVPHIKPRAGAITGIIKTVDREYLLNNACGESLVLARMTAPLIRCCIDLVMNGKSAMIRGNDIAETFCNVAITICGEHPLPRFEHQLHNWAQDKLHEVDGDEDVSANVVDLIIDTADALQHCYDAFGNQCSTINQFCDRIRKLFSPEDIKNSTILSTIHRAKGDEARVVWILDSNELCPEQDNFNQEQQEENLTYVAITRSLETLYFVPNRMVGNDVGGVPILQDIDWDKLPQSNQTLPKQKHTEQLSLF